MTALLRTTLLYSLVPVIFTTAGAGLGAYVPAIRRLRGHVLHLAAGVVFAVVAVNLLPEIQRRALVWDVVLGFALGIATMLLADKLLDRIRDDSSDRTETRDDGDAEKPGHNSGLGAGLHPRESGIPLVPRRQAGGGRVEISLLVAVAIDFLLDGLLLGVGFAAGSRIGILLALAEAAEQLSVGMALAGELTHGGMARSRIILLVTALGSLVFVSAVLGATILSGLTGGAMETVLSFGLAALLYLVIEELLREAHEEKESAGGTLLFFAGFLLFLVIGMTLE